MYTDSVVRSLDVVRSRCSRMRSPIAVDTILAALANHHLPHLREV
ncbi:hypothetical protein [Leptothermofonsia sichuanensis]|nr:hypothetical protein [Leptothermofonsia sichuanensis]